MKWIQHDTDANQDAKLQNVLLDYGLEGYGLYWYCIELIAGKVDANNITFELEHDARVIARNTGSTPQKVEEMMRYFVNIGLFENSNNTITCLKLAKRLTQSMTSNPQMREIIKNFKGHDEVMTKSDGVMQDKIRLEENRVDKECAVVAAKEKKQSLDYDRIKEIFNTSLTKASNIVKLTEKRKKLVKKLFDDFELDYERFESYLTFLNDHPDAQWMFERRIKTDGSGQYWNAQTFEYFVSEKCFLNAKENMQ
ncbi:hypothetical protein SIPHO058v2_p0072 [Vibrio phage 14E30.2]|nr:hypothetical protein SIPHO058v2_p0072 [Vibrio phage 14E30.2]